VKRKILKAYQNFDDNITSIIKKNLDETNLTISRQVCLAIFGKLVWPILIFVIDILYYYWIRLVKIFFVIPVMLLLEPLFSFSFFSLLSPQIRFFPIIL